jgi:hypothetical protein
MSDWILIPCLRRLFLEFNQIAPGRSKASDGSIGDTAHQREVSDHNADETGSVPIHDADKVNEVHAIDVDSDLRDQALSMELVVQFLVSRCRTGREKRLRYIIFNRRIWEAKNGWKPRPYTGASAHTEHAHFSASYETEHERDESSWHLEEIDMTMTPADREWFTAEMDKAATKAAARVWSTKIIDRMDTNKPPRELTADAWMGYSDGRPVDRVAAAVKAALAPQLAALATAVGQNLLSDADERAIIDGILAGLTAPDKTDEQVAAALRVVLGGERAQTVGALLAHAPDGGNMPTNS